LSFPPYLSAGTSKHRRKVPQRGLHLPISFFEVSEYSSAVTKYELERNLIMYRKKLTEMRFKKMM
jgi:hypothetical protein